MSVKSTEEMEKIHDTVIKKHAMDPFWVFSDQYGGEKSGGHYWCFIGAHYPAGLVAEGRQEYDIAVDDLRVGHWKAMALAAAPGTKIGFGCDDTPSLAFVKACRMAGYLKAGV